MNTETRNAWTDGRNAGNDRHHDSFHADPRDIEKARIVVIDALNDGGATITRGYEPVDLDGHWSVGGYHREQSHKLNFSVITSWDDDLSALDSGVLIDRFHEPASADGRDNGDESPTYYTLATVEEITRLATLLHKFIVSSPSFIVESHVGLWVDDGRLYFDIVRLFDDRDAAIEAGRERHQISIFNGTTFGVEWLDYDGAVWFKPEHGLLVIDPDGGIKLVGGQDDDREHPEVLGTYRLIRPFTSAERKQFGGTHLAQRGDRFGPDFLDSLQSLYFAVTFK